MMALASCGHGSCTAQKCKPCSLAASELGRGLKPDAVNWRPKDYIWPAEVFCAQCLKFYFLINSQNLKIQRAHMRTQLFVFCEIK